MNKTWPWLLNWPSAMLLAVIIGAAPAIAAPQSLTLTAANMLAQTQSHAIVMHFTSTYQRLSGILRFDPATLTCSIDVRFVVSSLTAPNALFRSQMMSKKFLDPADYPLTRYQGVCKGGRLIGSLTLRGQTHPFDMDIVYLGNPAQPAAIRAQGSINRYEWGIYGMRMTVGQVIEVNDTIALNGQPLAP